MVKARKDLCGLPAGSGLGFCWFPRWEHFAWAGLEHFQLTRTLSSHCNQETISSLYKYFLSSLLHLSPRTAADLVLCRQLPIRACLGRRAALEKAALTLPVLRLQGERGIRQV